MVREGETKSENYGNGIGKDERSLVSQGSSPPLLGDTAPNLAVSFTFFLPFLEDIIHNSETAAR